MRSITFYEIAFRHRIKKAKLILKIYIYLTIYIKYLINLIYLPKKINLDQLNLNEDSKINELSKLFDYFNSDKGDYFENQYVHPMKRNLQKIQGHGYAKIYEKYFHNFRDKNINIMEIGSFYGNASAALFFYFKKSNIYAGDIFPDLFRYKSKRILNFYVNSSDEKSIKDNIIDKFDNKFDIIIEDASHYLKDQIISLFMIFRKLNKGGLFIIEELDFPDTRHDANKFNEKPTLKELLLSFKQKNFDIESKYISKVDKKYFIENLKDINIYRGNFNEVAIIEKK